MSTTGQFNVGDAEGSEDWLDSFVLQIMICLLLAFVILTLDLVWIMTRGGLKSMK